MAADWKAAARQACLPGSPNAAGCDCETEAALVELCQRIDELLQRRLGEHAQRLELSLACQHGHTTPLQMRRPSAALPIDVVGSKLGREGTRSSTSDTGVAGREVPSLPRHSIKEQLRHSTFSVTFASPVADASRSAPIGGPRPAPPAPRLEPDVQKIGSVDSSATDDAAGGRDLSNAATYTSTGSSALPKTPHFHPSALVAQPGLGSGPPRCFTKSSSARHWKERRACARNQSSLQRFVRGSRFESFWASAIFSYAIFVGLQAHYSASSRTNLQGDMAWLGMNWAFSIVFLIELFIRMLALGTGFFLDADCRWNFFDMIIGWLSIVEMAFDVWFLCIKDASSATADSNSSGTMRIIRVLRVARLVRIVRIVRIVRFVRALRALVYSILGTLRSLLWAMILLFIIIYVFAVVFTQAVADHLEMHATLLDEDFGNFWGGLPRSMLTLFECVSNGLSWYEAIGPLMRMSAVWAALFVFYICFASLAVMNVVTGVFCQSAIDGAAFDQELLIQEQMKTRSKFRDGIRQIFEDIDEDHQGRITIEQLEDHIEDPRMQAYFAALELESADALSFFRILDATEGIDCEDFVMGCTRLKGSAKAIHVAQLIHENKKIRQHISRLLQWLEGETDGIPPMSSTMSSREAGRAPGLARLHAAMMDSGAGSPRSQGGSGNFGRENADKGMTRDQIPQSPQKGEQLPQRVDHLLDQLPQKADHPFILDSAGNVAIPVASVERAPEAIGKDRFDGILPGLLS